MLPSHANPCTTSPLLFRYSTNPSGAPFCNPAIGTHTAPNPIPSSGITPLNPSVTYSAPPVPLYPTTM